MSEKATASGAPWVVVIRADASNLIGTGHVVRCAALAQALTRSGARCLFICRPLAGHLMGWLAAQGLPAVALPERPKPDGAPWAVDAATDAADTLAAIASHVGHAEWVLVDHYGLDARWQGRLRSTRTRLAVIDDMANRPHVADLLLDPNLQPHVDRYRDLVPVGCRQFLGTRQALLRPEFVAARQAAQNASLAPEVSADAGAAAALKATNAPARPTPFRRPAAPIQPEQQRLLACMGGSDPHDVLSMVIDAWQLLPEPRPQLAIAVGTSSENAQHLQRRCAGVARLQLHLSAANMAELIAEADLLICSAGSISWERCCLGVPGLMVATADNQRDNLARLSRSRTGISLGNWDTVSAERMTHLAGRLLARPRLLRRLGERAGRLVDGQGARRVANWMLRPTLRLEPAGADDAERVWPWRNHPNTRRYSTDSRPVPLDQHRQWWRNAVLDPQRSLFIARVGQDAVGVLRLDHEGPAATVSIYLDPALTGLGLGVSLLQAATRWGQAQQGRVRRLLATIDPRNQASQDAFSRAGYAHVGSGWTLELGDA